MSDKVTIKIPQELFTTLQDMINGTGFSSVTEFIVFILRSIATKGSITDNCDFSEEEINAIKNRLKKLGYF